MFMVNRASCVNCSRPILSVASSTTEDNSHACSWAAVSRDVLRIRCTCPCC